MEKNMNKRLWVSGAIIGAALLGLLLGGVAEAKDEAPPASIETKILNAKSKADHQELAEYYEKEAKSLRASVQLQQEMYDVYGKVGFSEKNVLRRHCASLAKEYEEAARENLEMAKIHRRLAEKAK
jgi:hypothetical protein